LSTLATSTLLGPQTGIRNSSLFVLTSCGDHHDPGDDPNHPPPWDLASGSRASFEQALLESLANDHSYPATIGETMLRSLGWQGGLSLLCRLHPAALRLALTDLTCRLLPEMVPVPTASGGIAWLDTVVPVFRTLGHVNRPMVARLADPSLAILYQVERDGIFEALAEKIRRALPLELAVDEYPGEDLANEARRVAMMQQVFFEHRAVLFLGHLRRPRDGGSGGWMMTDKYALPLSELRTLLGGSRSRRQAPRRPSAATPPVPELVLCGCCCGAWGDPGARGATDLFYPELFLAAGVRFFVGSWTDVVVRVPGVSAAQSPDLDTLARLFSGFLERWAGAPDHAVAHLYHAKEALGFPLLASLFQLYTAVEPLPVEEAEDVEAAPSVAAEPMPVSGGALIDRLEPGMSLGPYRLAREIWRDRYAVAFWAESPSGRHIVQVLADAWQDEADLPRDLHAALEHLQGLGLGEGQLVPDRLESHPLPDLGDGALRLFALIYDRPQDEASEEWFHLRESPLDRNHNDHYRRVLELGAQAATRLWELHAKGVLHGNFDPGCIVIHRRVSAAETRETIYVKDAWVQNVRPGRCTETRYAAPEEPAQESGPAQLKQDCWGLGVVLYELATGHAPDQHTSIREAVGLHADRVPEALDRVVRECLIPAAAVRPAAEAVARRLLLAINMGGTYVEDIEAQFDVAIRAGHRLFAVRVEDIGEIERVLGGLQAHPRADVRYHLYIAAEEKGIVDCQSNRTVLPWKDAATVQQELSAAGRPIESPSPPIVAAWNGLEILGWAANLDAPPEGEMPVLLLRGIDWWEGRDLSQMVFSWRILKHAQREWGYPVIVVADSLIRPIGDIASAFLLLDFPPPPPSELFERLLAASKTVPGGAALAPETAASIGDRLFPCPARELEELFRLCALRYGCIDERIVELRDQERGRRFSGGGVMSYLPFAALPPLDHVGWPPALAASIPAWLAGLREEGIGPRRVLILGPQGHGKSFAARALAGALRLPLIRLETSRCLQRELGGSEAWLRAALDGINDLGGVAVLLDGIDGFAPADGEPDTTLNATLSRMSSILRNWIEGAPPAAVVLMTATDEGRIPGSWKRLFDRRLVMNEPALDGVDRLAMLYRESVLRALFRKFQLPALAGDDELVAHLARETHPDLRGRPLPSAVARRRSGGALRTLAVELRDGSQIEDWMATTILHHTPLGEPERPGHRSFWQEAVG
jgi:hypothetical protein